jgi:hypothetical protein
MIGGSAGDNFRGHNLGLAILPIKLPEVSECPTGSEYL